MEKVNEILEQIGDAELYVGSCSKHGEQVQYLRVLDADPYCCGDSCLKCVKELIEALGV